MRDDVAIERARWAFNEAIGVDVDAPTEVADVRDASRAARRSTTR